MGYLSNNAPGTDSSNYGLNIYDVTGNIILGANGLGTSVVYPINMPLGTTTVAYGAWGGSNIVALNTPGVNDFTVAAFSINVQAIGEGVMIVSSGMFTSVNASNLAPTPPYIPPPAPPPPTPEPPYVPPPEDPRTGGEGGS